MLSMIQSASDSWPLPMIGKMPAPENQTIVYSSDIFDIINYYHWWGKYRMNTIFQWGLNFIIMIQQIDTPLLDSFFRAITSLGDKSFYLLLFPFLLWCVDFYLGIRVGIIFLLSVYVNNGIKEIFQQPALLIFYRKFKRSMPLDMVFPAVMPSHPWLSGEV